VKRVESLLHFCLLPFYFCLTLERYSLLTVVFLSTTVSLPRERPRMESMAISRIASSATTPITIHIGSIPVVVCVLLVCAGWFVVVV